MYSSAWTVRSDSTARLVVFDTLARAFDSCIESNSVSEATAALAATSPTASYPTIVSPLPPLPPDPQTDHRLRRDPVRAGRTAGKQTFTGV